MNDYGHLAGGALSIVQFGPGVRAIATHASLTWRKISWAPGGGVVLLHAARPRIFPAIFSPHTLARKSISVLGHAKIFAVVFLCLGFCYPHRIERFPDRACKHSGRGVRRGGSLCTFRLSLSCWGSVRFFCYTLRVRVLVRCSFGGALLNPVRGSRYPEGCDRSAFGLS